ncbi:hypothetical protein M0R45_035480 [Rubus argutus]|uniref:Uncharacterized protein n=1 Tax=Rubus argutus TaxID=59490 RepID=A0AAW1VXN1_RUBAR
MNKAATDREQIWEPAGHGFDRDEDVTALGQKRGGIECGGLVELTASMAVESNEGFRENGLVIMVFCD